MYESKIIQYLIKRTEDYFHTVNPDCSIFSKSALSLDGLYVNEHETIRLLSDDDIIYVTKNLVADKLTNEYFSRNIRLHPIWKTEAEYNTLFVRNLGQERLKNLEDQIVEIEKKITSDFGFPLLNEDTLQYYMFKQKEIEENLLLPSKDKQTLIKGCTNILNWLNCLKSYSQEKNIEFCYAIISANQFNSGFSKVDINNIMIWFPSLHKHNKIKDVQNILTSSTPYREKMFYLYYKPKSGFNINTVELTNAIFKKCVFT